MALDVCKWALIWNEKFLHDGEQIEIEGRKFIVKYFLKDNYGEIPTLALVEEAPKLMLRNGATRVRVHRCIEYDKDPQGQNKWYLRWSYGETSETETIETETDIKNIIENNYLKLEEAYCSVEEVKELMQ